jgi:O-acetylserine/cysteine efflux transporter
MSLLHLLLLLATVSVWGFNFVAIKMALYTFPPIFLCFLRFLLSALPLIFFIPKPTIPLRKIALYSSVTFVLQFSILFIAMKSGVTPGVASILLQLQSFFAVLFAIFVMKEPYRLKQAVGFGVALLGIVLIVFNLGGETTLLGLSLVLSAAALWASGSILAKQFGVGGVPLVVWSSLIACPPLLLLSFLFEGPELIGDSLRNFNWTSVAAVSYVAYGSTLFGFGTWNWLLQKHPVSKLSPFTLLAPVVAMISSSLLLGETIHWWKIAAAAFILTGLALHLLPAKRAEVESSQS